MSLFTNREFRWRLITASILTIGYAGFYLCRYNLSVVATMDSFYGENGVVSETEYGWLVTIGIAFYGLGKFSNGILTDYLGGKRMLLIGMFISVLVNFLLGFTTAIISMILIVAVNRFVQSGGWAGLVKVTSHWYSWRWYGSVMAVLSISYLVGDVITRVYLGIFVERGYSWSAIIFISAATFLAITLLLMWLLREKPGDLGLPEPETNPENVYGEKGNEDHPDSIKDLILPFLTSVSFWMVLIMSFGLTMIREVFNSWSGPLIKELSDVSAGVAVFGSIAFPLGGLVSVLLCGFLSDRLAKGNRAKIIVPGLVLACGAILFFDAIKDEGNYYLIVLALGLVALFLIGPYSFLGAAIALDLGGKRGSASASGIIDGVGYFVGGTFAGGGISWVRAEYDWAGVIILLLFMTILSTAAAIIYWWRVHLKEKRLHLNEA
ncbi:MAG: MFS transporter [Leptospiraceae bacterium]|nr:MFS transporter [Leptospiraceae bacterium]